MQQVPQMTDYDTPQFKTSAVAEAAGITHATLRSYFKRDQWRIIGQPAAGEGLPNLFSLRDAMTFAIAARLMEASGANPCEAFDVAVAVFSHTGDWRRNPGQLFDIRELGETLLVYWKDTGTAQLMPAGEVKSVSVLFGPPNNPQSAATVIVLNPIEHRVFGALGAEAGTA